MTVLSMQVMLKVLLVYLFWNIDWEIWNVTLSELHKSTLIMNYINTDLGIGRSKSDIFQAWTFSVDSWNLGGARDAAGAWQLWEQTFSAECWGLCNHLQNERSHEVMKSSFLFKMFRQQHKHLGIYLNTLVPWITHFLNIYFTYFCKGDKFPLCVFPSSTVLDSSF